MRSELVFHGSLAIASLIAVSAFWSEPFVLFALLVALSVAALVWRSSRRKLVVYFVIAVLGPAAEAVAISFGAWSYAAPQLFGVPFWLAPLWGLAGVFIIGIGDALRTWPA